VNASTARVTCDATVGMYEEAYAPTSSCARVTEPVTVKVKVPAVGVKVKVLRDG